MSLRDRAFLSRLRERDEEAFNQVVSDYQNKVFGLIYRMMGNREEAEDLAQEVFVTVFKSIDQFRGESKLSTWIYRIAANHCKNRMKYLSRRHTSPGGLDAVPEENKADGGIAPMQGHIDAPDAILEGREMERLMAQAITALDEDHRLLLVLRDVEELSYQEIVEITGMNEGTVKSRLHRARMHIKEHIGRHTGEGER